jgi:transcriptional regulator with XRE-family HTH domain
MNTPRPVGSLLREWRQRRRLSQLDFSMEAEISSKHLSFIETGRSQPSREMLLHLAELLEVPLREQNAMLMAAGFAPKFSERPLGDPALQSARAAVDLVLKGHEPYPAIAVDRRWTMVASNAAVAGLLAGIDPVMLKPPLNVMRLSLHPDGLASRIVNLAEWRSHLFARLRKQIAVSGDAVLIELLAELGEYPAPASHPAFEDSGAEPAFVVPFRLATPVGVLSFISTITVFGTPVDVTLAELAIESFFPADAVTAAILNESGRRA